MRSNFFNWSETVTPNGTTLLFTRDSYFDDLLIKVFDHGMTLLSAVHTLRTAAYTCNDLGDFSRRPLKRPKGNRASLLIANSPDFTYFAKLPPETTRRYSVWGQACVGRQARRSPRQDWPEPRPPSPSDLTDKLPGLQRLLRAESSPDV